VFKKHLLKILVTFLTSFIYLKRLLVFSSKKLFKPLKSCGVFFLHTIVIHFYKVYLFFFKLIKRFLNPLRQWALAPLGSSYAVYGVILIITSLTLFENINALETRYDEQSLELQNNIVFKLTSDTELELIQEKAITHQQQQVFSYLDDEVTKPYLSRDDMIQGLLKTEIDPVAFATEDTLVKPNIASTKTNLKLREKVQAYTILPGDTISGIASKFGLNVQSLLWANNLTVRSYIKPGQSLNIPPVNGIIYNVKKNDTLAAVAKKYQADVDKIIEFNRLADAQDIKIGQQLVLPGGEKPKPVVKYTPPKRTTTSIPTVYEKTTPKFTQKTSNSALLWPTDMRVITQYYSWRHTGLDIDGTYQTRNFASEDGVVTKAQGGWNGGYGLYIIINHGNGLETLYAHNSKIFVKVGDKVKRGQVIGMVGSTGRSTGTHIHYEVRQNGKRVNPLRYIK
jgi:murein DD-endopeptidase MepM/ murein hydrolase activator NlpD